MAMKKETYVGVRGGGWILSMYIKVGLAIMIEEY